MIDGPTDNGTTAAVIVTLTITHNLRTGDLDVLGPTQDRRLCYAMLELARDAIKDAADKKKVSAILPADPSLLPPGLTLHNS